MGNVLFNTDIDKTVDIAKNVNVNVIKNVQTNVDLNGSLASAEASADAVGGGNGNGGGGGGSATFLIDDFEDAQLVQANVVAGTDPAESTVAITTDIPDGQRRLFVDVLSDQGLANLGSNNPQLSKLDFSSANNAFTNALAEYTSGDGDPFDITPGVDNADILANPLNNTYNFSDIDFDPGTGADGQPATVRVSLVVEDDGGNMTITTVAFDGAFQNLAITGLLAGLIDPTVEPPPGTVLDADPVSGGQIVFIGTAGGGVNLDEVTSIQILLEDRPDTNTDGNDFNSGDFFAVDSVIDENLSVDGTDSSVDDFVLEINVEEDVFNIAETETFAQVTEDGAFAFSDSLAATNFQGVDNLI